MDDQPLRVGVLDVGCFSAHLVVVDAAGGDPLNPVLSHKVRLRLDLAIDEAGRISADGIGRICVAVADARRQAHRIGAARVVAFATSSIRDAANTGEVVGEVEWRTGIRLQMMSGEREAHLSYVAARRWFGCAAGKLTVLDVGGGTAELATGSGSLPLFTHSIPFGARTLGYAGPLDDVTELVEQELPALSEEFSGTRAVGCSKVFQQLARLAGARPQRDGPFVPRQLRLDDLAKWIPRLARLPVHRRAELPGISRHRARQSLAGAMLAEALMRVTGHEVVDICPWSTKEGLLFTVLEGSAGEPMVEQRVVAGDSDPWVSRLDALGDHQQQVPHRPTHNDVGISGDTVPRQAVRRAGG